MTISRQNVICNSPGSVSETLCTSSLLSCMSLLHLFLHHDLKNQFKKLNNETAELLKILCLAISGKEMINLGMFSYSKWRIVHYTSSSSSSSSSSQKNLCLHSADTKELCFGILLIVISGPTITLLCSLLHDTYDFCKDKN